ncbi:PaiA-like polyamine N(1)-acetyltransferase [Fulvivirga imtechensis AK7]|uniref:PaiA-like polyamine N(1)-acetyltransferase n=1 Tax=Fulvivirga imtechensis AK7 TaxID=1237149 RepID=L8JYK0_9BACT|nr:GNAT family N-acetyltransferase [Fulvivirga imtechensis]ELR72724.1 PaiA-like polyamine N(1)-acetyltransferase [Fulvivirga imtechensis AK7]
MTDLTKITIRQVGRGDLPALQQIGKTTFIEAFGAANSPANMEKYLSEKFSMEAIAMEVGDPESLFFFAESAGEALGYLKVNFGAAQTEPLPGKSLEIERIYVLADYYGQGVGKLLFNKALDIAGEKAMDVIWLGVWEENPRAIRFYEKNGFKEFGRHKFMLGDDEQIDIMMRLEISMIPNR